MLIDKASAGSDETIVLFPRSYNKRGDERLHSVQGVTLDGREVNIKLRVDEAMQGKENTPSIAEFSREDVKAKNPCLAAADNGPGAREGVLLFTGCEEDGENKKGILSFTARWGYVLASHSDAPEPVFGLGRVVMIADSHAAKTIHAEITELERTKIEGWEAISERKRKTLSDPMLFSYYGQLYIQEEEASFNPKDKDGLVEFARESFAKYTRNGIVGGLLIRLKDSEDNFVGGFSPEVFPRWKPGNAYQTADDVLGFFFRSSAKHITADTCEKVLVMPIKRYSCGPSFKNYYFLKKPEESLLKLRKRFLINNEPTVSDIAFALSRREDSGESFMLKYYPMGNPVSSVADIGKPLPVEESLPGKAERAPSIDPSVRIPVGLSETSSVMLPSWYSLGSLSGLEGPSEALVGSSGSQVSEVVIESTDSPSISSEQQPDPKQEVGQDGGDTPYERSISQQEDVSLTSGGENDQSPERDVDDGDLSDLFSEISDDELGEIEEAQRVALAERAKADLILAEQEAAAEAQQKADIAAEELKSGTSSPQDSCSNDPLINAQPSTPVSPDPVLTQVLKFVDDSAEKETPASQEPAIQLPAEKETATDEVPESAPEEERELSGLERMAKMRGLL